MAEHPNILERSFPSAALGSSRTIRICLPRSYASATHERYPVVYLHDGQNVFSTAGDWSCYGWGSWQADRTAWALAEAGKTRELILVAIDNSRDRYGDYRGPSEKDLNQPTLFSPPLSMELSSFQKYSRFLIEELKPWVDHELRTLPDSRSTAVIGSSLGGLCSLALAWQSPEIFGCAGSLSGAFQVDRAFFIRAVLAPYAGPVKPFRCYLDSGVVDYTGGDDGRANTLRVVKELRRIGWRDGHDLHYLLDDQPRSLEQLRQSGLPESKWGEAATNQHNEFYWRLRFGGVLERFFARG